MDNMDHMSAAQHTPGPWIAAPYSSVVGAPVVASPNGRSIANVTYFGLGADFQNHDDESAANARLIAAAPDLKSVADNFQINGPDDDGLLWLVLHGNGTTGKAMFNLGPAERLAGQVALALEEDRHAALAKTTGAPANG